MIEYLHIQNLALIKDTELEFAPGMNVLTGETGAGKSFIINALNFLTGERKPASLVRPGHDKATVEAVFVLPDREIVLRRELMAESGRSRIFMNNALSTQEEIRLLRPALILHTSQFEQQKLLLPAYQAALVDACLDEPELLAGREKFGKAVKSLHERRGELLQKCRALQEKRDLLEFQRQEIEQVKPLKDEEKTLEERKVIIKSAGQRKAATERLRDLLQGNDGRPGLLEGFSAMDREIAVMARIDPAYESYMGSIGEMRVALQELDRGLKPAPEQLYSEKDLERIEARLFALAQLRRKLGRPLNEIVDLAVEIDENLQFLDSCQLDLRQIEREEKELLDNLASVLQQLNQARRRAAEKFTKALIEQLSGLGFDKGVEVQALFSAEEVFGLQEERPRLLWRPNPGQPAQPLDKIASGGELSRFLLALAGLQAMNDDLPTLIFDEIDAGVGGLTLNKVAEHMESLARRQQIILITHWPRLAAMAGKNGRHYQVIKKIVNNETFSYCRLLRDQAINEELVRMAGGEEQASLLHQLG